MQPTGAAVGDLVRSVGFAGGHKIVRDHVPITSTTDREIELGEAPCDATAGAPAIDETSGQVVGVLSRSGPSCDVADGYDVDTRTDAFYALVEEALAQGTMSHATDMAKEKKGAVDIGAGCIHGADCAAGACVAFAAAQYCTRLCSRDRPLSEHVPMHEHPAGELHRVRGRLAPKGAPVPKSRGGRAEGAPYAARRT